MLDKSCNVKNKRIMFDNRTAQLKLLGLQWDSSSCTRKILGHSDLAIEKDGGLVQCSVVAVAGYTYFRTCQ